MVRREDRVALFLGLAPRKACHTRLRRMSRRVRRSEIGHKLKKVYRRGDIVVSDSVNSGNPATLL